MVTPDFSDTTLRLRVWWTSGQGLMKYYYVTDVQQAIVVTATLIERERDDDSIDYNASGLEEYDAKYQEWTEFYDDDGQDIKEIMEV